MQRTRLATANFGVRLLGTALAACLCASTLGCVNAMSANSGLSVTAYDIKAALDPGSGEFDGQTTLAMRCESPPKGRFAAEFALNRSLTISEVVGDGVTVRECSLVPAHESADDDEDEKDEGGPGHEGLLAVHRVLLDGPASRFSLTFKYAGKLRQDVSAGERPGQIHNFEMAAHVAPEGIFLDASGGWYPTLHADPDTPPHGELASYSLEVDRIPGVELIAGAVFDEAASRKSGKLVWRSQRPLDGLALVGGPYRSKHKTAGNVEITLYYTSPDDPDQAAMLERNTSLFLDAAAKYLERDQPLIGPFPSRKYSIVQSFFSSGFAFPEFTWLAPALFMMGPRALGHGYLDHEMLHSWWGNGIYVDPADGNWCEAITSYGANYYGYILDGDQAGARKYRRNACNLITALDPEDDKPLGTFGEEDGAGRGIGYNKGAMVFHMLAGKIGQENFWKAMRRLTAEYTGKYANWRTLQTLFEQEGGVKLDRFFKEWVRTGGAPYLTLTKAKWNAARRLLKVKIDQQTTGFELAVPLRIVFDDGATRDETVAMSKRVATVDIPLDRTPKSVILDPDYQVLRKLHPGEIMPTSRTTLSAHKLLVVTPAGKISPFYERLIKRFEDKDKPEKVTRRTVDELKPGDLTQQSLLIIGDAAKAAPVRALLARTNCPVAWTGSAFSIDGDDFASPNHSVLCTVHHPDVPGGGVTIYYGNSEDAIGRSDLMLYYGNSLVAFETTAKEVEGEKQYKSRVLLRKDFEQPLVIDVQR